MIKKDFTRMERLETLSTSYGLNNSFIFHRLLSCYDISFYSLCGPAEKVPQHMMDTEK